MRVSGHLARKPATLAMVGFSKVDQLEIKSEGPPQLIGLLGRKAAYLKDRLLHQRLSFVDGAGMLGIATANGRLPQFFDLSVEVLARLLANHLPEQRTQRTNIAPQRRLF